MPTRTPSAVSSRITRARLDASASLHRQLVSPGFRAREDQRAQVRAGDQQHDAGDAPAAHPAAARSAARKSRSQPIAPDSTETVRARYSSRCDVRNCDGRAARRQSGHIVVICARASPSVTPGRSRPVVATQLDVPATIDASDRLIVGTRVIGTEMSCSIAMLRPRKPLRRDTDDRQRARRRP